MNEKKGRIQNGEHAALSSFGVLVAPETAVSDEMYGLDAPRSESDIRKQACRHFYQIGVSPLLSDTRFRAALGVIRDRQEEAFRRAESGDKGPYSKFVSRSVGEHDPRVLLANLLNHFPFFVALCVTKGTDKPTLERVWAAETGKTWKSLKEFPQRLRKTAQEIERLNQSIMFCPERAIWSDTPTAKLAKNQFTRLPRTLEMYAIWLELWIGKIPALTAEHLGLGPRKDRSSMLPTLSHLTFLVTGRFLDTEVSDLLNAADLVLNSPSETRFHPQSLADARSRSKRKTGKT